MKGNFVWDLPDLRSSEPALRAIGLVINDWQFSGVWTASTANPYTVGFNYQNGGGSVNLTGTPDYGARIRLLGDPGAGCSSDLYRQFNTARVRRAAGRQRRPRIWCSTISADASRR